MITSQWLVVRLSNKKCAPADPISKVMLKQFRKMSSEMPISELSRVLEKNFSVFVDGSHVVTSHDLLDFMAKNM